MAQIIMARDQELIKQLQQHLQNWTDRTITFDFELFGDDFQHVAFYKDEDPEDREPRCVFDKQGRLIQLHLCRLGLSQIPSEVWQCSSLQTLNLSYNRLSSLPAELGQL